MKQTDKEETVISVSDLYKIYKLGQERVPALRGVSFEVKRGTFCAIVGTSGSGKSTLLNMLAGLEPPTKGEVIVAGEHMEHKRENQLVAFRRKHVGFIFQAYNLIPSLNALENVALPLSFRGVRKSVRIRAADRYLDLVGLQKYKKHRPNEMSGGQQQRVGMARALVCDPEIIYADEPTGNLDSNTSEEMMNLMRNIVHERGCTLVMVTHDNHLASYADQVVRIQDGKVKEITTGEALRERMEAMEKAVAGQV
ncbi:MAG: ABC transporter ATP-binding protein [Lachnospiraceae bacterium]|nr:ABC transporter ATP-binding protein [Lachnospiraceae bacterium]